MCSRRRAHNLEMPIAGRDVNVTGHNALAIDRLLRRDFRRLSSRSAKRVVKPAGICWVTTTAGLSAGKSHSTTRSASTPPVEAPMATIRSAALEPTRAIADVAFAPSWELCRARAPWLRSSPSRQSRPACVGDEAVDLAGRPSASGCNRSRRSRAP